MLSDFNAVVIHFWKQIPHVSHSCSNFFLFLTVVLCFKSTPPFILGVGFTFLKYLLKCMLVQRVLQLILFQKDQIPILCKFLKVFASAKKFENIKDWSQLH